MIILVCGGRDFRDYVWVKNELDKIANLAELLDDPVTEIVHGGARGADSLAGDYARSVGLKETVFMANWDRHGKRAGFIRNSEMADYGPDLVIAFPGGQGTKNMIQISSERNIPVHFPGDWFREK